MTLQLTPTEIERPLPEDPTPGGPRRRGPSRLLVVLLAVLAIAVGSLAWAIWNASTVAEEALAPIAEVPIAENGTVVIEALRNASDLATAEAVSYVTIERGVDTGILDWATGDRVGMLVVANVGAGIDLADIGPEDVVADPMTGEITITMPEPRVLYVDVDEEATTVFDRDTGFFVDPDPGLEQQARQEAEGLLESRAVEAGLLDRAAERAEVVITQLAEAFGYETITVIP
jgi:hypothetical protein